MDYKELISNAIEKDEVVKLLRGEGEYEIVVSEFASDVFPTDVNSVLVNCFYKQKGNIKRTASYRLGWIRYFFIFQLDWSYDLFRET